MLNDTYLTLAGILLLAAGTYGFRYAGPRLGKQVWLTAARQQIFSDASLLLLFSVAVLASVYERGEYGGHARIAGIVVAVVLCLARAPFLAVITLAAGATALLRLLGVH
ncbi:AzlD domain-containing protein [Endozoicomonadaceae bacterium StTr2]